ncbi:MAG: hypothetical protein RR205_00910 [Oscillospiraceae bacterium]
MKKLISLALAVSMLATMGVNAFAAAKKPFDDTGVRVSNSGNGVVQDAGNYEVYFPIYYDTTKQLPITDTTRVTGKTIIKDKTTLAGANVSKTSNYIYDDDINKMSNIKLKVKLTGNKEYVKASYIDMIDGADAGLGNDWRGIEVYAVVLELNKNYTPKDVRVKGNIALTRGTGSKLNSFDFNYKLMLTKASSTDSATGGMLAMDITPGTTSKVDASINVIDFNTKRIAINNAAYPQWEKDKLAYDKYIAAKPVDETSQAYIDWAKNPVKDPGTAPAKQLYYGPFQIADFKSNVDNIELEDNDGFYFTVKASSQGQVNLVYDNKANKKVALKAPANADLTFYNFYGKPTFDFTGTATFTFPNEGTKYYLYQINNDNTLKKVNAVMNKDKDAFEIKTRTLGCYVMSDKQLKSTTK